MQNPAQAPQTDPFKDIWQHLGKINNQFTVDYETFKRDMGSDENLRNIFDYLGHADESFSTKWGDFMILRDNSLGTQKKSPNETGSSDFGSGVSEQTLETPEDPLGQPDSTEAAMQSMLDMSRTFAQEGMQTDERITQRVNEIKSEAEQRLNTEIANLQKLVDDGSLSVEQAQEQAAIKENEINESLLNTFDTDETIVNSVTDWNNKARQQFLENSKAFMHIQEQKEAAKENYRPDYVPMNIGGSITMVPNKFPFNMQANFSTALHETFTKQVPKEFKSVELSAYAEAMRYNQKMLEQVSSMDDAEDFKHVIPLEGQDYMNPLAQWQRDKLGKTKKVSEWKTEFTQRRDEARDKVRGLLKDILSLDEQIEKNNLSRDILGSKTVGEFMERSTAIIGDQAARILPSLLGGSFVAEIGNNYLEQVQGIAREKGISPMEVIEQGLDDPALSQISGTLSGSLDMLGTGKVLNTLKNAVQNSIKKKAIEIIGTGATEAVLEGAQNAISQWQTIFVDGQKEFRLRDMFSESAAGFVGALGLSAPSIIASNPKANTNTTTEAKTNEAEQAVVDAKIEEPAVEAKETIKPKEETTVKDEQPTEKPKEEKPKEEKVEPDQAPDNPKQPQPEATPLPKEIVSLREEYDQLEAKTYTKAGNLRKNADPENVSRLQELQTLITDKTEEYYLSEEKKSQAANKEATAKENKDFEERAYEGLSEQERFEAVIEDKAAVGETLTPEELTFVNETYFRPKGYDYDASFSLVPSKEESKPSETSTDLKIKEEALDKMGKALIELAPEPIKNQVTEFINKGKNLSKKDIKEATTWRFLDANDISQEQIESLEKSGIKVSEDGFTVELNNGKTKLKTGISNALEIYQQVASQFPEKADKPKKPTVRKLPPQPSERSYIEQNAHPDNIPALERKISFYEQNLSEAKKANNSGMIKLYTDKLATEKKALVAASNYVPSETDQDVSTDMRRGSGNAKLTTYPDQMRGRKTPRIKSAPIKVEKPKPVDQIVLSLGKIVPSKISRKKLPGGALGYYRPSNAGVIIKYTGDLDTLAHEIGHALDDAHNIYNLPDDSVYTELVPAFSDYGSRPNSNMSPDQQKKYIRQEGIAEFIRAWLVNPEAAAKAAPDFNKEFESAVPKETLELLRQFGDDIRAIEGASAPQRILAWVSSIDPKKKGKFWSNPLAKRFIDGKIQFSWLDDVVTKFVNPNRPFEIAVKYAMKELGIKQLKPSNQPMIMARLLLGIDDKVGNMFQSGLVNAQNKRQTQNGEVMNFNWLLGATDQTNAETIQNDLNDAIGLMIAERTLELPIKEIENAIKEQHKKGNYVPEYIINFNDRIRDKFKSQNDAIKENIEEALIEVEESMNDEAQILEQEYSDRLERINNEYLDSQGTKNEISDEVFQERVKTAKEVFDTKLESLNEKYNAVYNRVWRAKKGEVAIPSPRRVWTGIGAGLKQDVDLASETVDYFEDLKEKNPERHQRVTETAKRYRQWSNTVLEYLKDKGRISNKQYQQIKADNLQYVALQRVMSTSAEDEIIVHTKNDRTLGASSELIHSVKGSSRFIKDPLYSMMDFTFKAYREADRNEVLQLFSKLFNKSRGMNKGNPSYLSNIAQETDAGDPNGIVVFKAGKKQYWKLHPEVFKAIKNITDSSGDVFWALRAPAQLLRFTVTHFPVFQFKNRPRDTQNRWIVSRSARPLDSIANIPLKKAQRDKRKEIKGQFELYGGGQAGFILNDRNWYDGLLSDSIHELAKDKSVIIANGQKLEGIDRFVQLFKEKPRRAWRLYNNWLQGFENATRIDEFDSAFRKAKSEGMNDHDANVYAAFEARDLMDFQLMGTWMRKVNQVIPFSNAWVRGMSRSFTDLANIHKDPKAAGRFAVRWFTYSVVPSILTRMLAEGMGMGDEYEKLPAWRRDLFYNVPLWNGKWLVIPKPFELGVLGSGAERLSSYAMYGEDNAFDDYIGSVAKSFFPYGELGSLAGGIKPFVEVAINKDTFRDTEIVPKWEEKLDVALRDDSRASNLGKIFKGMVGAVGIDSDARSIDHLIKGTTSYFGDFAMRISDIGRTDRKNLIDWNFLGFTKDDEVSNSKDVTWLKNKAEKLGLTNVVQFQNLNALIRAYYEQKSEKNMDEANRLKSEIYTYAERLRKYMEENEIEYLIKEGHKQKMAAEKTNR